MMSSVRYDMNIDIDCLLLRLFRLSYLGIFLLLGYYDVRNGGKSKPRNGGKSVASSS